MIKLSNDIHIHFVLEKEIVKITILKKHTETLCSILKVNLRLYQRYKTIHNQLTPKCHKTNDRSKKM